MCLAWLNVIMGRLQKSKNNTQKNYLHVDIKCSSLKYSIIQYNEPISYGEEHKESTRLQKIQIHFANTSWFFFFKNPFSYNYFTCQWRMIEMWLSFATAFTSAFKSSDWTQKMIQIHDDSPLLTTDLNNNPAGTQSNSLQSRTKTKHGLNECEEGQERVKLSALLCNMRALQSTMAMDIRWTVVGLFYVFTK